MKKVLASILAISLLAGCDGDYSDVPSIVETEDGYTQFDVNIIEDMINESDDAIVEVDSSNACFDVNLDGIISEEDSEKITNDLKEVGGNLNE